MRHLKFLLITTVIVLSSCTKIGPAGEEPVGEALLQIGLSVDGGVEIAPTKSGEAKPMDPKTIPAVDSMYVELYRFGFRSDKPNAKKETWNRIYFGKYEEAKSKTFRVNAGDWKLVSFRGDSTGCGFNEPFFYVAKEFEIDGGLDEKGEPVVATVDATARVENVRIAVNFSDNVQGSFYDYFVRISNVDDSMKKYKQILRYPKGETRDAYMMPTDSLVIEFMAQYEYGDQDSWKYVNLLSSESNPDGIISVKGNDFLTISLDVSPRNGNLVVNVKADDNIIKKETDVEIKEFWAPQDPPQVVAAGFVDNDHAVVEGDNTGNSATVSVVARGGLKNFFLTVTSDYFTSAGIDIPLGEKIDLANPSTAQPGSIEKLKAAGFVWDDQMLGSRSLTYMKMTDLFKKINSLNPSLTVERALGTFTIEVVDEVGYNTVKTLTATAYPITQVLSIPEGRVWARKIVSPTVTISKGVGKLFRLQVSSDGQNWSDLTGYTRLDNSILSYGTLDVEPNTVYYYRSVYNNNQNLISNVVTVKTEETLGIGNSSFEDYHTTTMHVSPLGWLYDYDREWYLPYKENETDAWWAVNSKATMPDGHTAWTSNWCKNFPCTAYSTDAHTGNRSAMVYTVNVGSGNTDGTAVGTSVPGEIWIGKADNDGNHTKDGHSFASRPSSVTFWYKYQPMGSEKFVVTVMILDKNGQKIGGGEILDGQMATEWTECTIPIIYDIKETKAGGIYISFKSCSSGGVNIASSMEIAGRQQTAHIGSALRIDDITLTY
ncbi:MAG: DUF4493 domain-containing protein [Bacteroidales bacterium]|nr:DUF4493 domain-containing protein [Bacteroidales bacterium]